MMRKIEYFFNFFVSESEKGIFLILNFEKQSFVLAFFDNFDLVLFLFLLFIKLNQQGGNVLTCFFNEFNGAFILPFNKLSKEIIGDIFNNKEFHNQWILLFSFWIFLFFILVLLVVITQLRFCFKDIFSRQSFEPVIFIFLAMVLNFFIISFDSIGLTFFSLVFLSYYSMYLVLNGYGVNSYVLVVLFFKIFADIFIMLYLGVLFNLNFFFNQDVGEISLNHFKSFEIFLVLPFLIYSLFNIFGFWIFWAMEANHFVSSYLHSVGFITTGFLFLSKFYYLEVFSNYTGLINWVFLSSFLNFLFFIIIGFFVKDLKKSYGYFSASSISYLFIYFVVSPVLGSLYLGISAFIKIIFFTLLGYSGKFKEGSKEVHVFYVLVLLEVIFYSTHIYYITFLKYSYLSDLLYLIFLIKLIFLVSLLFKVISKQDLYFSRIILFKNFFSLYNIYKGLTTVLSLALLSFLFFIAFIKGLLKFLIIFSFFVFIVLFFIFHNQLIFLYKIKLLDTYIKRLLENLLKYLKYLTTYFEYDIDKSCFFNFFNIFYLEYNFNPIEFLLNFLFIIIFIIIICV